MRKPRDLRHRGSIRGEAHPLEASVEVPVGNGIARQPREWRRAAAWLRRVADWWEFLADEQEMRQARPLRRRLLVCEAKEEERDLIAGITDDDDYTEEGQNIAKAILARETPPEVVRPAVNRAAAPTYVEIVEDRDAEWLAAIAAAGVTVKEAEKPEFPTG